MDWKESALTIYKNRIFRIGAGILLAVLFFWWFLKPKPITVETGFVTKGTYEQIVEEDGVTRVKDRFTLYSPVNGVLQRVHKHVGEPVQKGETVAVINWDYDRKIQAPVSGTVLTIHRESAGPISIGAPILDIGDTSRLEIACELLTQDSVEVRPGNPVIIEGWGGDPISGKVRLIEPAAFTKVSSLGVEEQRVRVIIDFDPPSQIGDSFQVKTKITAFQKENSLLLPTAALFRDQKDWAVYRVQKGKAKKTIVKIEAKSGKWSLLTEGLQDGDEVVLYPTEEIKEGARVK
ncbi:efflux RND transporter periplasmic adaptor subunit [Leptospira wolffii]|uniref:Efflux RND transporter periplasmic adaptor subunit n=1 Tax=Leptospira wolffii TaxID=409998 RepID=A0ABV5BSI8_9LEPT